jgi:hypothetical protein
MSEQAPIEGRRVFFTHIMKTGGTSIVAALEHGLDPTATFPLPGTPEERIAAKLGIEGLLESPPERLAAIGCFSVHQPPWVGRAVAPDALQVVVLREPVARTVSHLRHLARSNARPDFLSVIYDEPGWRDRLVDYQTQILSSTREEYDERRRRIAEFGEAIAEKGRAEIEAALREAMVSGRHYFTPTVIEAPRPMSSDDIEVAIGVLDSMDVVGTTDDLPGFVAAVSARCGRELVVPGQMNTSRQQAPVDPKLMERIRADQDADRVVYAHARRLAARS